MKQLFLQPIVWWFFTLSALFTTLHLTAMRYFLYWHFWWLDVVMHTWGGILIVIAIHMLSTFPHIPVRATYLWVGAVLFVATVSWELFELYFGLFNPIGYTADTIQDILLAWTGGLLTHRLFVRYKMH